MLPSTCIFYHSKEKNNQLFGALTKMSPNLRMGLLHYYSRMMVLCISIIISHCLASLSKMELELNSLD